MRKLEDSSRTKTNQTILNSALLFVGAITSVLLLSKKTKKLRNKAYNFDPDTPVPTFSKDNPHESEYFFQLILSRKQYEELKGYGRKNKLVFQFFYPAVSNCGSPTLFAYNMKREHLPTGKPPIVLAYGEPSKEQPIRGRNQVLGDNSIEIAVLDKLIKRATKKTQGCFSNLIFNPIFIPVNPHIAYEINVDGSAESEVTNPSPPG